MYFVWLSVYVCYTMLSFCSILEVLTDGLLYQRNKLGAMDRDNVQEGSIEFPDIV